MIQTSGLVPSIEAEGPSVGHLSLQRKFVSSGLGGYLSGDVRIWLRLPGECFSSSVNLWMCFVDRWGIGVSMPQPGCSLPPVCSWGCLVLGSGQQNLLMPWLFSEITAILMSFSAVCFTVSVLNSKWIFPHGLEVSKHRKEQTDISVRIPSGSACPPQW